MVADTFVRTPLAKPPVDGADAFVRAEAEAWYARHANYVPPRGHATWCQMQLPSCWRPARLGNTKMAEPGCTCSRNALARHLRKLSDVISE